MTQREGYIIVDHSASPGLPPEIAKAAGYDPKFCGEGQTFEAATLTCSHCKTSSIKNPLRVRERERCFKCSHYICDPCGIASREADYNHMPYEKLVDVTFELAERGIILGSPPGLLMPREIT